MVGWGGDRGGGGTGRGGGGGGVEDEKPFRDETEMSEMRGSEIWYHRIGHALR